MDDPAIEDARIRGEAPRADGTAEPAPRTAARRPGVRLMWSHPAHLLSLGFGSGLSPVAPGTFGTLWAWLSFHVLDLWLTPSGWGALLAGGTLVGWWACTRTAQALGTADPSAVVWDELLAFWAVLWLVSPAGWGVEVVAFALFRFFDAAKPGPVAWADRLFKAAPAAAPGWRQGLGILLDDAVAALCTLLVLALLRTGHLL
jgi:phosphatidylglycerophosphatase A